MAVHTTKLSSYADSGRIGSNRSRWREPTWHALGHSTIINVPPPPVDAKDLACQSHVPGFIHRFTEKEISMSTSQKVAVLVGSLRKDSLNRRAAHAPRRAGAGGDGTEDRRDRGPAACTIRISIDRAAAGLGRVSRPDQSSGRRAVRDAGIQPLGARRAEERDRCRVAAVWAKRLERQAGGGDVRVARAPLAGLAPITICVSRWCS